jgi:hypothetical protein
MIKDLIILANNLDNKGLVKEADYVDRIIKKYSQDETTEERHPSDDKIRTFVRDVINPESKGGGHLTNPINMFAYEKSEESIINERFLIDDHGMEYYFGNHGKGGTYSQRKEELETMLESAFKGITSPGGVILDEGSIYRKKYDVYSLRYTETEDGTGQLVVVRDIAL